MKPKEISITDAEWEIMESVWQADDQTPAEILSRIEVGNRSHRTLRTLLNRLVEKGAVAVCVDGSKHLYSSAVSRETCVRMVAKSFSKRFAGSMQSMLLHFVESEALTDEELKELQQRLEELTSRPKPTSKNIRGKRGN